ncbi:hypothetical protein ROZALSC1DRAFT_24352 [Rozella allomycis CSF55]|uniref:Uncharacterized protein n=1 Tax=Rozella allomycis (strain CSF55) TaxID=988480 RepID=A0A4V1IZ96_ROZAC|nr:hypothetical protein ROZALSC1DRAFT_24352 [Rozella allomycis CSF55]
MTRGNGGKDCETRRMLDIVNEILPAGGFQWDEVTVKYNLRRPSAEEDDDRLEAQGDTAAENGVTNFVISGDMIMPFDELLAEQDKEEFEDPSFDFTQFEEDNPFSTQPELDTEPNSILSTLRAKRKMKTITKLDLPYSLPRLVIEDLKKIKINNVLSHTAQQRLEKNFKSLIKRQILKHHLIL